MSLAAKYLVPLQKAPEAKPDEGVEAWPEIEILARAKDEAQNKSFFEQVVKEMQSLVKPSFYMLDPAQLLSPGHHS